MTCPGFWWFTRTSWRYLGCDRGSGRWTARRRLARELVPRYLRFRRSYRTDVVR